MNLLFYVEPLIEMERPFWKEPWANDFCLRFIKSLRNSQAGDAWKFTMAFNEPLEWQFTGDDDINRVVFQQEELLQPFTENAYQIAKKWYEGKYSKKEMEYYKDLIRSKMAEFVPDIIIAFAPAPFLAEAFPQALLLYKEYSIFSRPPLPRSWYLDPKGMFAQSSISSFQEKIKNLTLTAEQQQLVSSFKSGLQKIILEKSPYRNLMSEKRKGREHLVLLPLQFSGYYSFDSMVKYKSQYEFLEDVLKSLPESIGVVVVSHPEYPVVDDDARTYLERKYPHFINDAVFGEYHASSQYLMAEIDGVITVSSSVAWHTLFWDKKLIDLSCGNFKCIADTDQLAQTEQVLKQKTKPKDAILDWIIRHYAILEDYLTDGEWLNTYLQKSLKKYRAGGISFDYFEPLDEQAVVYEKLTAALDHDVPYKSKTMMLVKDLKMQITELNQRQADQQKLIAELNENSLRQADHINNLDQQLQSREQQLRRIEETRAWKMIKKYYALKEKYLPAPGTGKNKRTGDAQDNPTNGGSAIR